MPGFHKTTLKRWLRGSQFTQRDILANVTWGCNAKMDHLESWKELLRFIEQLLHTRENEHSLWKMTVGRLLSFWCDFPGAFWQTFGWVTSLQDLFKCRVTILEFNVATYRICVYTSNISWTPKTFAPNLNERVQVNLGFAGFAEHEKQRKSRDSKKKTLSLKEPDKKLWTRSIIRANLCGQIKLASEWQTFLHNLDGYSIHGVYFL